LKPIVHKTILLALLILSLALHIVTTVTARSIDDQPPSGSGSMQASSTSPRWADLLPAVDQPRGVSYPNPGPVRPADDPDHAYLFECLAEDKPECPPPADRP
jgi:hypothetical protein